MRSCVASRPTIHAKRLTEKSAPSSCRCANNWPAMHAGHWWSYWLQLLSLVAGLLGTFLAYWSFSFLQGLVPAEMALTTTLTLDTRILAFTILVSIITGIVFGLVPALQAARVDLNEALKQGGTRATSSGRLRSALIVFEVALSVVLLIGAGLLIQTLFQIFQQYSILKPEKVLTLRTELPRAKAKEPQQRNQFLQQVLERVEHLPGVESAGYTTSIPGRC